MKYLSAPKFISVFRRLIIVLTLLCFVFPVEEPFSGSISPGLPDPGGNIDDSCEDDIVFLPVPDGLWYIIFLSFIYALIKVFRGKLKEKKVLKQITSI